MADQATLSPSELGVLAERLGPLPLINHFLSRMGLLELLEQHVPTTDRRSTLSHAQALGVLLRSIIVEREPIYRQQETTSGFALGVRFAPVRSSPRAPATPAAGPLNTVVVVAAARPPRQSLRFVSRRPQGRRCS